MFQGDVEQKEATGQKKKDNSIKFYIKFLV